MFMLHYQSLLRTRLHRRAISTFLAVLLILTGCAKHEDVKRSASATAAIAAPRHDAEQKECHKHVCVQVQFLSQEVLRTLQRENIKKLQAIHNTNKDLVGAATILKKYATSGDSFNSPQRNTLDFTVIVETDSTSMQGRQYFEIAQELESSLQEQASLITEHHATLTPVMVRLYEVHPLQHSWQFIVTFVYNSTKPTNYVFHWSDTVLKTGRYAISL